MSLDGYIAGPNDSGFDLLFQWYGNGDVELPSASPDVPPVRISAASARLIKQEWGDFGALLEAGLLDEVGVELVPVVLGAGTPLFADLGTTPVQFDGPFTVVEGTGVTHLRYRVKK